MAKLRTSDDDTGFVFPGARAERHFPNVHDHVDAKDGRDDLTAHGFRSTFRDWCAEATDYPNEMAETALAHLVSDKVEAAYRRGDMMERRRQMMRRLGAVLWIGR